MDKKKNKNSENKNEEEIIDPEITFTVQTDEFTLTTQAEEAQKDPENNYQTQSAGDLPEDDLDRADNAGREDSFIEVNSKEGYENTGNAVRDRELNEIEGGNYINDLDERIDEDLKNTREVRNKGDEAEIHKYRVDKYSVDEDGKDTIDKKS